MNSEIELDNIVDLLSKAKKIAIFTHISPDGDAIGSSLALYLGFLQLKKEVSIVTDDFSRCFNFLPHLEEIQKEVDGFFDVSIALDCATKGRLFDPKGVFEQSDMTVAIDHHASNTYFAKMNYVEGNSPATCKTLVKVFKRLGIVITKEIGSCLMAGIITDSGGFRYDTVDDETFEFAASMLDLGVDISDIYYRTFDVKTKSQFKLSTLATSRIKFYAKDKIALTYITLDDMKKTKAMAGDHEGIVNIGRNIEGVEVSIFLREVDKDFYRVSLRSNDYVDVSGVASLFNGGGHSKAAGCDVHENLEVAIKKLVKETTKVL
ncbi:MAG: bifunctional oligoribonuclease/PAP phosphatase NrnA [Bacilli bacterium]|nr:bifunctional oligoribonuclease/PAP phosphatase NrnA [Bacilli bacterium]